MSELLAEMRAFDAVLEGDDRLAVIRSALREAVEQLDSVTSWLIEHGASDPNAAGSASVNFLMLAGVVVGGWQMARASQAIVNGAAKDDPEYAVAKLATTDFYAQHILSRASAYGAAATAGSAAVMTLSEKSF